MTTELHSVSSGFHVDTFFIRRTMEVMWQHNLLYGIELSVVSNFRSYDSNERKLLRFAPMLRMMQCSIVALFCGKPA